MAKGRSEGGGSTKECCRRRAKRKGAEGRRQGRPLPPGPLHHVGSLNPDSNDRALPAQPQLVPAATHPCTTAFHPRAPCAAGVMPCATDEPSRRQVLGLPVLFLCRSLANAVNPSCSPMPPRPGLPKHCTHHCRAAASASLSARARAHCVAPRKAEPLLVYNLAVATSCAFTANTAMTSLVSTRRALSGISSSAHDAHHTGTNTSPNLVIVVLSCHRLTLLASGHEHSLIVALA